MRVIPHTSMTVANLSPLHTHKLCLNLYDLLNGYAAYEYKINYILVYIVASNQYYVCIYVYVSLTCSDTHFILFNVRVCCVPLFLLSLDFWHTYKILFARVFVEMRIYIFYYLNKPRPSLSLIGNDSRVSCAVF